MLCRENIIAQRPLSVSGRVECGDEVTWIKPTQEATAYRDVGVVVLVFSVAGYLLYIILSLAILGISYFGNMMREANFRTYIRQVQEAQPTLKWSFEAWHFEKDSNSQKKKVGNASCRAGQPNRRFPG